MKRANLIPSVLFGAILASIIITSPEAESLKLPVTPGPQVVEFSGTPTQQPTPKLQSERPAAAEQSTFSPYSQNFDNYNAESVSNQQPSEAVFALQAG